MARSVGEIEAIQRIVHLVEYVLVAVYAAHLWHMLFADNHDFKHWLDHHGLSGDWVVTTGTAVASLVGFGLVWLFNRVRHRHKSGKSL